jgi:molybdenum cofactor biosynthesis enzyme MoaA
MKVKLFDTEIELRNHYCSLNNMKPMNVEKPYINLYVQFKGCNANCKFCEYKNLGHNFNVEKFNDVLNKLSTQIEVRKISLTGGESTINKNFYNVVDIISKYDSFLVVNTNGTNLKEIHKKGYTEKFNSIALSRHHYKDEINNEILQFDAISCQELKNMKLNNLHLSCNLQKDYINDENEIYKYLDFASEIGCDDVGFVSLMKINDYSKEQYIDFDNLKLNFDRYHKIKEWKYEDNCKCNNYLYLTDNGNIVKVYNRSVLKQSSSISNIVFDGENLKLGFNEKIII